MSRQTRNNSNLPEYYLKLNGKQKSNWRKNTTKIERNEQLRSEYPPYYPSSNINVIHLHHQTKINTIDQLIHQAKTTTRYTLDTESQRGQHKEHGALVQIQMVHSIYDSTVILWEIYHLPDVNSLLAERMKELWSIIFNSGNEIITWGPIHKEFQNFQHLDWIRTGKIKKKNLQSLFQDWQDGTLTHPETESREVITGVSLDTPGDDDYDDSENEYYANYNDTNDDEQKIKYSLQKAVAITLHKFLDKMQTLNYWNCGLELILGTWNNKIFSRRYYDVQVEKQQRTKMIEYAVHDCTSVAEIYFVMYPDQAEITISRSITRTTTRTTIDDTPKPTPIIINEHEDYLSDVSDEEIDIYIPQTRLQPIDEPNTLTNINIKLQNELYNVNEEELVLMLKPRFDKKQTIINQSHELIITTTQQEINELNPFDPQQMNNRKNKPQQRQNL
jgi:hypothetical protein